MGWQLFLLARRLHPILHPNWYNSCYVIIVQIVLELSLESFEEDNVFKLHQGLLEGWA